MGMDVYGMNDSTYFRRNVWRWRPLAKLVCKTAPSITRHCKNWQSNDGDGLTAKQSTQLAAVLEVALASGHVAVLIAEREERLRRLPNETCCICKGTGVRIDDLGREEGQHLKLIETAGHPRHGQTGWCNGCDGRGACRPAETDYTVDEDDVREFAAFLRECEGFEIC